MIFITVGSQKFQFDRLLEAADRLETDEEIFAQTGYSGYKPSHYKTKSFLDKTEFLSFMKKADIVITHGGTGSIVNAIKMNKKVIAVPRLAEYGEHVNNHQLQIIEAFEKENLIYACWDMNLEKALEAVKNSNFTQYKSNTDRIINDLEEYIDSL